MACFRVVSGVGRRSCRLGDVKAEGTRNYWPLIFLNYGVSRAPTIKVEPQGPPLRPMAPPRPGAGGLRQGHSTRQTDGALCWAVPHGGGDIQKNRLSVAAARVSARGFLSPCSAPRVARRARRVAKIKPPKRSRAEQKKNQTPNTRHGGAISEWRR